MITLLSWLQSSLRKTTSRFFSDISWNLGAITLQGPHLQMIEHYCRLRFYNLHLIYSLRFYNLQCHIIL
jgi:hypothetical protein